MRAKLAKKVAGVEIYVAFNGFWIYLFEDPDNEFCTWEYFTEDPCEALYYLRTCSCKSK